LGGLPQVSKYPRSMPRRGFETILVPGKFLRTRFSWGDPPKFLSAPRDTPPGGFKSVYFRGYSPGHGRLLGDFPKFLSAPSRRPKVFAWGGTPELQFTPGWSTYVVLYLPCLAPGVYPTGTVDLRKTRTAPSFLGPTSKPHQGLTPDSFA
jgi:hypothetical protein